MDRNDFYTTIAQVYPVLLLALIWDTRYFEKLRSRPRRPRSEDPVNGVWFWTLTRIRIYTVGLTLTIVLGFGAAMLTLAGVLNDGVVLRWFLVATLGLILTTLVFRVWDEVMR